MPTPRRSAHPRTSTASAASTPLRNGSAAEAHPSPRDMRHAHLIAARAASEARSEAPDDEAEAEAVAVGSGSASASASDSEKDEQEDAGGSHDGSDGGSDDDASDSDSASDSGSDSDSDSDSASDSGSDTSEPESESDDEDELDRQLAAARAAAAAAEKPSAAKTSIFAGALGEDEDGEMRFDADAPKEAPIPDLAVGSLPAQVLSFAEDGTARAGAPPASAEGKKEGAPELDRGEYQRSLSKREKKAQPKKASASELWATIPAPRSDDLAQMKRDYQALALSNTLDPKRFMKGGNRAGKVPERFQIGTMVDAPRHLQDTTVRKERKYRAGEIVAGVVADEQLGSYAKRKFEDLQGKRMHNGRGKGWQKRTKW